MFWRIFREMTIFLWNSSCFYSFSWNCSSNLRYDVLTKFSLNYLAFFVCKTPYFYSFFSSTWAVYNYYCSFYELFWTVTWQLIGEIFFSWKCYLISNIFRENGHHQGWRIEGCFVLLFPFDWFCKIKILEITSWRLFVWIN